MFNLVEWLKEYWVVVLGVVVMLVFLWWIMSMYPHISDCPGGMCNATMC